MNIYSITIGINNYLDSRINPLKYAQSDANKIFEFVTKDLNIEIDEIESNDQLTKENHYLLKENEATRHNILSTISMVASSCQLNDLFIFYFAGHGNSIKYTSTEMKEFQENTIDDDGYIKYLIPHDVDIDQIVSTAISFQSLSSEFQRIKSNKQIAILDCCFSGAANGRTFNPKPWQRDINPNNLSIKPIEVLSGSGRVVLAACTGREFANELSTYNHGVFTYFLLEGLKGFADTYSTGTINELDLYSYARHFTSKATENKQNPIRNGDTEGHPIILAKINRINLAHKLSDDEKFSISTSIAKKFINSRVQRVFISDDDSSSSIGQVAAKYLENAIFHNQGIAVSCGSTLIETITQMNRLKTTGVEIFPLNGSPDDEVRLTDSMVLTYLIWSKFDPGSAKANVVPTGISKKTFEKIKHSIKLQVKEILNQSKKAKIFLFGIGTPKITNFNIKHMIEDSGQNFAYFETLGAVGEINFQLYDRNGNFLIENETLNEEERKTVELYGSKYFALHPKDLREIATGNADIIVVAGGESKREAIAAAIRGKFVRILITDLKTAIWLRDFAEVI